MKKFLLGTSALVGSAALVVGAAQAQVTVGGYADFRLSVADQDSGFEVSTGDIDYTREEHFTTDTEVHINYDGTADNGLRYGAVIELEADVDGGTANEGSDSSGNSDKVYIYVESSAGRVEAGNNVGAAQALNIGAQSIARATGGIRGAFHDYASVGQDADQGDFTTANIWYLPALPSEIDVDSDGNDIVDEEEATKISYFTPRIHGIQAGASYTIDTGDDGSPASLSGDSDADEYENLFSLGINWEGQFDDFGVGLAAVGEIGEAETTASEDINAYHIGAVLSYQGFSLAGSYIDNDDSRQSSGNIEVDGWTAGAAYESGPVGISVTYFESETEDSGGADDEFSNLVVGADYQLAPGLTPYAEVSFFEAEEGTSISNDGSVVLIGTLVNF